MHSKHYARRFPPITQSSCAAIVSAYRPSEALIGNVRILLEQFALVVVIDDGSHDDGAVLRACSTLGAVTAIQPENAGIGAALNRGVAIALAQRPALTSVITFDQDSVPAAGTLESYRVAVERAEADGLRVGGVGPGTVGGSVVRASRTHDAYSEVREPIQSGFLLPVEVLTNLGGFDEDLFIDGVDTDTYWRLVADGYSSIVANDVVLEHELGSRVPARLVGHPIKVRGRPLVIMQSAPFRYYYLARNRVLLTRRYFRQHPFTMIRGALLDLRHLGVVVALGSEKQERLAFALRGVRDGLAGVTGRLQASNNSASGRAARRGASA